MTMPYMSWDKQETYEERHADIEERRRSHGPIVRGAFIEAGHEFWVRASHIVAVTTWKGAGGLARITLSTGNVVETPYPVNHILDTILLAEQLRD